MQQRLADLRTEYDMARELAEDLKAESEAGWQEFERCRDEFRTLRALGRVVDDFNDGDAHDDVDDRLTGQAVMVARARMEAAHQARLRASCRFSWARKRCEALRATLRAAEYLAEQGEASR